MDRAYVGIDVSKDRLDVHVRPEGEAFAVARDGEGLAELVERLRPLGPELWRWKRPAASRPSWRPRWRGCAAGGGGQSGAGAPLRPGARPTRQDRPDRRRGDRALCRGHQARAPPPAGRGDPGAGRSGRAPAADHRHDGGRAPAREARPGQAARAEQRAGDPGAREGARRPRPGHRRHRARLAGLAREGGSARLRPRRRGRSPRAPSSPSCPSSAPSTAADRRPGWPRSLHPPVRPMAEASPSSAAAAPASAPPSSSPPWPRCVTTPPSGFPPAPLAAGKPKMVAMVACIRKLLTILNAILRDKKPWQQIA